MGLIDIIILCCFIPAFIVGLRKGLVSQIVAVLVIYLGITLSIRFSGVVSAWILNTTAFNQTAVNIVSFILIFFVVAILLNLLGKLVEKIIRITMLSWLNKLLGVILSLFITLLLMSVGLSILNYLNGLVNFIPDDQIANSALFQPILNFAENVFPYLKSIF